MYMKKCFVSFLFLNNKDHELQFLSRMGRINCVTIFEEKKSYKKWKNICSKNRINCSLYMYVLIDCYFNVWAILGLNTLYIILVKVMYTVTCYIYKLRASNLFFAVHHKSDKTFCITHLFYSLQALQMIRIIILEAGG